MKTPQPPTSINKGRYCKHNESMELRKGTSYPDGLFWQCQICGQRFTTDQFCSRLVEIPDAEMKLHISIEGLDIEGSISN